MASQNKRPRHPQPPNPKTPYSHPDAGYRAAEVQVGAILIETWDLVNIYEKQWRLCLCICQAIIYTANAFANASAEYWVPRMAPESVADSLYSICCDRDSARILVESVARRNVKGRVLRVNVCGNLRLA